MKPDKIVKYKYLFILVPIFVLIFVLIMIGISYFHQSELTNVATMDEAVATTVAPTLNLGSKNHVVKTVLGSDKRLSVNDNVVYTKSELSTVDESDILKSIGYESGSYMLVFYDVTVADSKRYYGPTYVTLNENTSTADSYVLTKVDGSIQHMSLTSTLKQGTTYNCVSVIKCDDFKTAQIGFTSGDSVVMLQLNVDSGGDINEVE